MQLNYNFLYIISSCRKAIEMYFLWMSWKLRISKSVRFVWNKIDHYIRLNSQLKCLAIFEYSSGSLFVKVSFSLLLDTLFRVGFQFILFCGLQGLYRKAIDLLKAPSLVSDGMRYTACSYFTFRCTVEKLVNWIVLESILQRVRYGSWFGACSRKCR